MRVFWQRELSSADDDVAPLTQQLVTSRQELLAVKDQLAGDLTAMTRLYEFSTRMISGGGLDALLDEVLTAILALQDADLGNIQLYDPKTRTLNIVAQRGFGADFLRHFAAVTDEGAACGRAWIARERVVIEDVDSDPQFERHKVIAAAAGFRAVQSTPLFGRSGEPLGVISTHFRAPHRPSERTLRLTDLYAQQAAEMIERTGIDAALRRSEANLAEGQRLSHTGSWAWNVATGDLFWSQEHLRIFGLDPDAAPPSYAESWDMVHQEDRSATREQFERQVAATAEFDAHYRIVRADGTVRHIHSLSHPVFNAEGDVVEYVGTVIDTTERRQADEALRVAQAELAHVTRVMSMGELTASIAHEINQPLAAIVANGNACLRWLARPTPDLTEARQAVVRMIDDGNRASEIVQRIRAFARRSAPQKTRLDVNDVVREVLALLGGAVMKQQILLRVDLSATSPVLADRVELQQVILNLVTNAIEAMSTLPDDAKELRITSASQGAVVLVEVQDTGSGVDPRMLPLLFDAFYTTKPTGLGLGLSISRRIVEAHGGRLWATPNAGPGMRLSFSLPADAERAS